MKAVRIHEFGGPDQVHVEDVPLPKVARGKALVRIRAAAVNPVDWMVREHMYNPKGADRLPLTLGQDFAGVIEKIGSGSKTSLREGDEVFGEVFGSFAEFALVPVKDLVKKPASLDFKIAAALPCRRSRRGKRSSIPPRPDPGCASSSTGRAAAWARSRRSSRAGRVPKSPLPRASRASVS